MVIYTVENSNGGSNLPSLLNRKYLPNVLWQFRCLLRLFVATEDSPAVRHAATLIKVVRVAVCVCYVLWALANMQRFSAFDLPALSEVFYYRK